MLILCIINIYHYQYKSFIIRKFHLFQTSTTLYHPRRIISITIHQNLQLFIYQIKIYPNQQCNKTGQDIFRDDEHNKFNNSNPKYNIFANQIHHFHHGKYEICAIYYRTCFNTIPPNQLYLNQELHQSIVAPPIYLNVMQLSSFHQPVICNSYHEQMESSAKYLNSHSCQPCHNPRRYIFWCWTC